MTVPKKRLTGATPAEAFANNDEVELVMMGYVVANEAPAQITARRDADLRKGRRGASNSFADTRGGGYFKSAEDDLKE